jgi:hypothetical protein
MTPKSASRSYSFINMQRTSKTELYKRLEGQSVDLDYEKCWPYFR